MKHKKNHLLLGSFVIVGAFLIVGAIVTLGAKGAFRKGVMMESYFIEPVTGLDKGSPVRFRGVQIGKVQEITMSRAVYESEAEYNYALVRVVVYPELLGIPLQEDMVGKTREHLERGLRVKLVQTNIAGMTHLDAVYAEPPRPEDELKYDWTPATIYVPSTPSTFEAFKKPAERLLEELSNTDIAGTVAAARKTFETIDRALKDADIAGLRQEVQGFLADARETLADVRAEVQRLSAQAQTTLQNADAALTKANTLLGKPELEQAIARLDQLTENADKALIDMRKLLRRADRTVVSVQNAVHGRGRDIAAIADGLRELIDNLNSLSGTLERYPSLLLFGNAPKPADKTSADKTSATKAPEASK